MTSAQDFGSSLNEYLPACGFSPAIYVAYTYLSIPYDPNVNALAESWLAQSYASKNSRPRYVSYVYEQKRCNKIVATRLNQPVTSAVTAGLKALV